MSMLLGIILVLVFWGALFAGVIIWMRSITKRRGQ